MIKPNVNCTIQSVGGHDVYGEEKLGLIRRTRCSVVRLVVKTMKTSVRADSSSSGGAADEITSISRLLFLPSVKVGSGDKVVVHGISLRVGTVHPRFNVRGIHDHDEVDLAIWA